MNERVEPQVGFIGLGNIGAPMCEQLVGWPGGLMVFDTRAEACDGLVSQGAVAARSVGELARDCQVVCVMVNDEQQVRAVLFDDGVFVNGCADTIILVHSTISVEGALTLAKDATNYSMHLLDAAVSGGPGGAQRAQLAMMVGGSQEAFDRCKPVLKRFGPVVLRMGEAGAGTRTKLARNLISFTSYAVVGEALRLAEAAGLDLRKLSAVVNHSDKQTGGPGAIMLRDTTAQIPIDDPLRPIFEHAAGLGRKDLELALALGDRLEVDLPFARLALEQLAAALGVEDH